MLCIPVLLFLGFKQLFGCLVFFLFFFAMATTNFTFSVYSALHYVLQSPCEKWGNILAILKWKETKPAHVSFLLILYCFISSRRPVFYYYYAHKECHVKTVYQRKHQFVSSIFFQKRTASFTSNPFHAKQIGSTHCHTHVELHWDSFAD